MWLMAQVTEYVSLLGWYSFRWDFCFTMSECHIHTMTYMPYYTMSVWHVPECTCIQITCTPPSLWNWVVESCTTPCHFDMSKNAHVPMSDVTLHPGNWMQSYRVVLHHASLPCGRIQVYPGQMYIPLQIKPSYTELNYSMSVWYVIAWRCTQVRWNPPTPPANRTSCYRVLVHHVSLKCGKKQMYPGQM